MHRFCYLLLPCLFLVGCSSTGRPIVGAASWVSDGYISRQQLTRGVLFNKDIPDDKKTMFLQAVNMGGRGDEVAVGLGINLLRIDEASKMNAKEWAAHITAVAIDLYAAFLVAKEAYDKIKDKYDDHDNPPQEPLTTPERSDIMTVNNGSGNVSILYGDAPRPGSIKIDNGAGNVTLEFE